MKKKDFTISISIPTFNRYDLLQRTLDSVFAQTEAPDEIIVVDDRSTDSTWEYLKTVKGITAYRNKKNLGIFGNWNESIRLAKSDFVVNLHSDDLISQDYIKTWKDKIRSVSGDAGAFISAGYKIDKDDYVLGIRQPLNNDLFIRKQDGLKTFWEQFIFYISVTGWTVYKRSIFDEIGYFSEKYGMAAENEMTLRILSHYNVYYCSTPLFAHRLHALQGFSGKVKRFRLEDEFKSLRENYTLLYEQEKMQIVQSAFPDESKTRKFIRYPLIVLLPHAFYYLITGKIKRGRGFLQIFWQYYPSPKISFLGVLLFILWTWKLSGQFMKNYLLCQRMKGKKMFAISS